MRQHQIFFLTLKNAVDQIGFWTFISKVTLLRMLNILVLSVIFTTTNHRTIGSEQLALGYSYFIPLIALSAAVAAWETELLANLSEDYVIHNVSMFWTRTATIVAECAFISTLFIALILYSGLGWNHVWVLIQMLVAFSVLGVGLGYLFGFRHEKAVNNFLNAVTWVLGFGPGPFMGHEPKGYQLLFPGGFSLAGNFFFECVKLSLIFTIALFLIWLGRRPRNDRIFSR